MSTRANVHVGGEVYYISNDGYPETVRPILQDFVKEARKFAKRNKDFSLLGAVQYLIERDPDGYMERGQSDHPNYEYEITAEGKVRRAKGSLL